MKVNETFCDCCNKEIKHSEYSYSFQKTHKATTIWWWVTKPNHESKIDICSDCWDLITDYAQKAKAKNLEKV